MKDWQDFYTDYLSCSDPNSIGCGEEIFDTYRVYPRSIRKHGKTWFFMEREPEKKYLILIGADADTYSLRGESMSIHGTHARKCDLCRENCDVMRTLFPFMSPSANVRGDIAIGFGDRLGVASAGHIRLVRDLPVYPVLAQQSKRELKLTGRTFAGVISDAAWAVFQEGYTRGYGADGDHLKDREAVRSTLEDNCTMITLDCSEHLRSEVQDASSAETMRWYSQIDVSVRADLEGRYLDQTFRLADGTGFSFTADNFYRIAATYFDTVQFSEEIYRDFVEKRQPEIGFELSIDETSFPTSAEAHFFLANELKRAGVKITSIAPRFCGEFQKGIDYRGNVDEFEKEYIVHQKIAEAFGYRLSIHSGSDKFRVFPCIGRHSNRYLLKTAGTSWLVAVKLIAQKNPGLYRRMHQFALKHFEEAKQYYVVTTDLTKVPDLEACRDDQLPVLMEMDDARQLMHITYGLILTAKNPDNTFMFREEFFRTLYACEKEYYEALGEHLGKHLKLLGIQKNMPADR